MKFNENLENLKVYEAGKPIELVVREFGIAPERVVKLASNRETAARKPRRQGRSLDAYQRAFFAVFPHYLPYHVEGYPIRLTFQERELWNRVKPASRKRMYRRYKPRRRPLRRVGLKRRTYRRRR